MGVTAASVRFAPGRWDVVAFVLASLGVILSIWLVVASDGDPSRVLWPLVVLPVAIVLVPVLVPVQPVRLGAALAMAAWCIVTGFSIGMLLWPALASQAVAIVREEP